MFTYMSKLASLLLYNRRTKGPDTPPGLPSMTEPPFELNSTALAPAQGLSEWAMQVEVIGYVYIMPIICALDIILNTMTILVFGRRVFRSPIYTYLSALALADVVTGVFTMPIGMSRCGSCNITTLEYSRIVYEVFVYVPITNMSETASAWMVIVLAVERLVSVKKPMVDKSSNKSRRRCHLVVAAVTLAAIALNLPYFFVLYINNDNHAMQTQFGESSGFEVFSWIRASLVQFAPLCILVILNCFLIHGVRMSQIRYRRICMATKASLREKAQIRLTLMLIGSVVLFLAGNVPIAFSYSILFSMIFGEENLHGDFYAAYRVITHLLALLSYALDFVIYCSVNYHFRTTCRDVLSCDRKKRKISDITPSSNKEFLTPTKF